METHFVASVLFAGGLDYVDEPDEMDPFNFAPQGHDVDFGSQWARGLPLPLESSQRPLFEALGTPPAHKQHTLIDGGHIPDRVPKYRRTASARRRLNDIQDNGEIMGVGGKVVKQKAKKGTQACGQERSCRKSKGCGEGRRQRRQEEQVAQSPARGYEGVYGGKRRSLTVIAVALAFSVAILLVADLDRPGGGFESKSGGS